MATTKYYKIVEQFGRGMDEKMCWDETMRTETYANGHFFSKREEHEFNRWLAVTDPHYTRVRFIKVITP